MQKKYKRLLTALATFLIISLGIKLILTSLDDNLTFYLNPTKIIENQNKYQGKKIKLGGLVMPNTLKRLDDDSFTFFITDCYNKIEIFYKGLIPKMFRNGQGVIAIGEYSRRSVTAHQVLVKHDEYYMPKKNEHQIPDMCKNIIDYKK